MSDQDAAGVGQEPDLRHDAPDYLHEDTFEAAFLADLGRPATSVEDLSQEELGWFAYGHLPSEHRERAGSDLAWWERDDADERNNAAGEQDRGAAEAPDPTTAAVEQCHDAVAAASTPAAESCPDETDRREQLTGWASHTDDARESGTEDALGR